MYLNHRKKNLCFTWTESLLLVQNLFKTGGVHHKLLQWKHCHFWSTCFWFHVGILWSSCTHRLTCTFECDNIPNNRHAIPTQEVTRYYSHLCDIQLDRMDENCDTLLLLGRDVPYVHRSLDQRTVHPDAPIGLRSPLGWTMVGDVWLKSQHSSSVNVYKTCVCLMDDHPYFNHVKMNLQLKSQLYHTC